jgi:hypothetical protein
LRKKGEPKLHSPINRFVTVHTLFKQHYADRILERRDALLSLDPTQQKFNAYNEAVKLEFQALKDDSPEEYELLDQMVLRMREGASKEFSDQSPDVQKR